jgi:predicted N-acetyltransferase YhbS
MGDHHVDPDMLREMAQHRGFRLLKSRRRKPGAGDFGRYGLTDAAGKPGLGVGPEGLTALPEQIEAYLRSGTLDSWKASATFALGSAGRAGSEQTQEKPGTDKARPSKGARQQRVSDVRARNLIDDKGKGGSSHSRPTSAKASEPLMRKRSVSDNPAASRPVVLRKPTKRDISPLCALLGELRGIKRTRKDVATYLSTGDKAGVGMLVAEKEGLIGCVGWATIPTVHRGLIGRITAILVTAKERRQGIGRSLFVAALTALEKAGCGSIEVMSDIDIRNNHNFFRSLDLAQTSYRFSRTITQGGT